MDNLFTFILGLAFDPRATAKAAFSQELQPYKLASVLCFVLTLGVPILAQLIKYNVQFYTIQIAIALAIVTIIGLFVFLFAEFFLLNIFSVEISFTQLFAMICYMLAQVTFGLWILYAIDYVRNGALTIVVSMMTGYLSPGDQTIKAVPYIVLYVQMLIIILVTSTIRAVSGVSRFTAFLLALVSAVPFYGSFACGVLVGDLFRPGTLAFFSTLFL